MIKICVITGTRAEYGLLKPIINKIKDDKQLGLQLVVTGMHISPEFGLTYKEILQDGFEISDKIEVLLSSDTPVGISKSIGLGIIGFAELFEKSKPDIVIILGDRYEIFAVASAAMIANIPIAHIHGGETTEGLIDEAIRHSITKMSYIHFPCTEEYRRRIIQLGESPDRVFNVGALGCENIKKIKFIDKEALKEELNIDFEKKVALLTFHPVTLDIFKAEKQFKEVLSAIDCFEDLQVIFTKANSDTGGRIINYLIDEYVRKNSNRCIAFSSLGQVRYLSAMKYCSFVIGNSSSGILEAPVLNKPTINIGDRQKGRIQLESIINCEAKKEDIIKAINIVLSEIFSKNIENIDNPYGKGNTSDMIIEIIKRFLNQQKIDLKKKFYDLLGSD
ncbi:MULTISPECIES: UDP-N-acetylglucosamine 2-epimerase [Clostridium]|uniref:UDP-N-acetylglucosamine 2-epimerase n=1 Tax=Clostridium TaxID=1485 RepID=UPI0012E4C647|nr:MULTISPECIES: UDP-N-acetylglucosamine 2-epimerase [Clostridium]MBS4780780.1 UDP-N-acetylglucosamine 2-epimerase (hydrolyzing) [Clostridium sp.]CAI3629219.1 GDP/UDP-N,N'-diacetylbacillosamine 2-epimerase (hydrolyzing) [Clostridium neonatale]SUQ53177.1 GDP/UDP-N,N'-diacetylbacillosamine 2-epimerase (hydrolyzing) [Clostridium neonatale]